MGAQSVSRVQLFVIPWTIACQAPLSMEFILARILECFVISSSRACAVPGFPQPGPNLTFLFHQNFLETSPQTGNKRWEEVAWGHGRTESWFSWVPVLSLSIITFVILGKSYISLDFSLLCKLGALNNIKRSAWGTIRTSKGDFSGW